MEGPEGLEEKPHIAPAERFPKTSSLKLAGFFKKLFKKIKRFFQRIAQAIVKFLQKVVSAITKAFTGMFGQKVGGFLASIVNAPFNFLLNSFHYISQGDYKGLLKYWGKVAVQVALMVFVAIVAPYLLGVLFGFLGAILTGIGSFLGAIGGFLANTVPLLGQVLGGALQFAGKALVQAGQFLSRIGTKLMTQSKQLFKDLREQGLKGIFQSFKDRILEKLNPITSYQNTWKSLTRGIHDLASKTGLSRFLGNVMEKVGVQIALQKIDKSLEKSKMSSFLKGILSTVSSAALQGLGSSIFGNESLPNQGPVAIERSPRGPPTGRPGFLERLRDGIGQVLKDIGGTIKSIFIPDSSSDSLSPAFEDLFQETLDRIDLDSEGNPYAYRLLQDRAQIEYKIDSIRDGISRADLGQGDFQFFRFDPQTRLIGKGERVGNLGSPSFVESIRGLADRADLFIDATTDTAIDFFGPVGLSPTSTQIFLGREYAKSLIDTLRLSDQFSAIKSDFLSAQASFQKGDYLDAARSFGSAGLRSLVEGGRILNLLPAVGLATKAISGLKIANPELQAVRQALSFGGRSTATEGRIVGKVLREFDAFNPGILPREVAETFAGGRYSAIRLEGDMVGYRAFGGRARATGGFFSLEKPGGTIQARIDSALRPEWGNPATQVAAFRIPKGTIIYKGKASSQGGLFIGGKDQIYIPPKRVRSSWEIYREELR